MKNSKRDEKLTFLDLDGHGYLTVLLLIFAESLFELRVIFFLITLVLMDIHGVLLLIHVDPDSLKLLNEDN